MERVATERKRKLSVETNEAREERVPSDGDYIIGEKRVSIFCSGNRGRGIEVMFRVPIPIREKGEKG